MEKINFPDVPPIHSQADHNQWLQRGVFVIENNNALACEWGFLQYWLYQTEPLSEHVGAYFLDEQNISEYIVNQTVSIIFHKISLLVCFLSNLIKS